RDALPATAITPSAGTCAATASQTGVAKPSEWRRRSSWGSSHAAIRSKALRPSPSFPANCEYTPARLATRRHASAAKTTPYAATRRRERERGGWKEPEAVRDGCASEDRASLPGRHVDMRQPAASRKAGRSV